MQISEAQLNQAWFQIKDLLVFCFTFLKQNMVVGQQATPALQSFYTATIRIVLIILKDYPEFLCEFHFSFVNSLPDHAIQLKNMVLAAVPRNISPPDPFSKDLKVDTLNDVKDPRILSNFEAYLSVNNLKEDLDNYFKTKKTSLINEICNKMSESKEKINGRIIASSAVINAVVLYIAT
jgi:CCR4-NOT transcription complex subunit 1